ncbi:MAG TPA: alpha/beta hydrolase, partial [Syntrophorhabdaceae bacterium]
ERYGKGEACVFMHGAGGSSLSWYSQRALQDRMEVVLLDLPGHGDSPGPAPDNIEEYCEAVQGTLAEMGLDRYYLAGHSMGGAIAMSLALSSPEKVKGLILIGTGAKLRVMPEFLEGILKDKEKTVRMIIDLAFGRTTPPEIKEEGFKAMMKCYARTIYNDYLACDKFDIMNRAEKITCPTLILCALSDLLTPPKYSEYLKWKIKGSEIKLIEQAGHMMMIEKGEEVNSAIRAFIG